MSEHWDFVIVGSGFGGSVSALRLVEKGYKVLLLEKGRRFSPSDFPTTNWNLRDWLWVPVLGFRGLFQMTFFRHVTVFSGVGVGGGSLVYANTLPVPKAEFFRSGSWADVADWQEELKPFYERAKQMLGVAKNPRMTPGDEVLKQIAADMGRSEHFEMTDVAVFFGPPGKTVPDPYFGGEGPERTGCLHCGGCMTGCRHGSKNTLDKNYLYLAEKKGLQIRAQHEVTAVRPRPEGGFRIEAREWTGLFGRQRHEYTADRVVLSAGVLGTMDLLLRMKADAEGLPRLSPRLGEMVRTNSESFIGVTTERRDLDLDEGVAITSILHTDDHSHMEPVRYARGSGFFRLFLAPHAPGDHGLVRVARAIGLLVRHPLRFLKAALVPDWARYTQILLYMRSLEGTLRFRRGPFGQLATGLADAEAPKAFIPEATDIAERFAAKVDGTPASLASETLLGIPSTAHILGGACIGKSENEGVIDADHQVYGYPGLYVVDGSTMSANPGVNPSLTITAMAERAMSRIAPANAAS